MWTPAARAALQELQQVGAAKKCHMHKVLIAALKALPGSGLKRKRKSQTPSVVVKVEKDAEKDVEKDAEEDFQQEVEKAVVEIEKADVAQDVEKDGEKAVVKIEKAVVKVEKDVEKGGEVIAVDDNVPWQTRVRSLPQAPRGNPQQLKVLAKAKQAALQSRPGTFRSCSRCGWCRFIPADSRQQHCSFPGRGPWRCGAQFALAGWHLCPVVAPECVDPQNAAILDAFLRVKLELEVPGDQGSNRRFLAVLRASTKAAVVEESHASL